MQVQQKVVLIVEEEALIRMNAAEVIEDAGDGVVEAGDAEEAIQVLENRDDVSIMFTDIDMLTGSMNGLRLAATVSRRWPPIRIIATSGRIAVRDGDLPAGSLFLPKPYTHNVQTAALADIAA